MIQDTDSSIMNNSPASPASVSRAELPWFHVGYSYGSNQEMMCDPWLRFGGCAAVTAVDSSIYFTLQKNRKKACPYNLRSLNQSLYDTIAGDMKPYLRPRFMGVNRLEIYTEGYGRWLSDHGENLISMDAFHLDHPEAEARTLVKAQIDGGLPIPFLLLSHRDPAMKDWLWHWFLLSGYEETPPRSNIVHPAGGSESVDTVSTPGTFRVKAVTYGSYAWLDFSLLWNTGFRQDGGMVIYHMNQKSAL